MHTDFACSMSILSSLERAESAYDEQHRRPCLAFVAMINAGFVICFVVICFVTNETNFFGIVGMGLMVVGTGSGTRKCFRALRFPRESAVSAGICYGVLALAGALTYLTVLTVIGRWNTVSLIAIAAESCHLIIAGCAIWRGFMLPEFDPNVPSIDVAENREAPLAPNAEVRAPEVAKRDPETGGKESGAGFVSPYEEPELVACPMRREVSVEIEIGNLPRGEAIPFPDQEEEDGVTRGKMSRAAFVCA
jgi:hypothetical protein